LVIGQAQSPCEQLFITLREQFFSPTFRRGCQSLLIPHVILTELFPSKLRSLREVDRNLD